MGSFGYALRDFGWIRGIRVRPGVVGFIRGRCVHSGALSQSSCTSVVVGFIGERPGSCRVYPASVVSLAVRPGLWVQLGVPRGSSGSSARVYWGVGVHPGCYRAHRRSLECVLGVVEFIRVR